MRLGSIGKAFLVSGIVLLVLCVICVFIPILGYSTSTCVDMDYLSMSYGENESSQLFCSVTANRAESVRVQLQAPSEDLLVMLISDGSGMVSNYSYSEYKSDYEGLYDHECVFLLSIYDREKDEPLKFVSHGYEDEEDLDFFLIDTEVTSDIYSYDYQLEDFEYYEAKSVFAIRGTNWTKLWKYGGSSRYEIYACNPYYETIHVDIEIYEATPGFDTSRASLRYSDVEDVVVPLSENVSSSVEQHVIVQYQRLPNVSTSLTMSSYILMDINPSSTYKHAMLGSYLAFVVLGVILLILGISILAAPEFFVRHFGSNNLRNLDESQYLNGRY